MFQKMRGRGFLLAVAVGLASAAEVTARVAHAEGPAPQEAPIDEARRLFREAVEREDAGDLAGALALYERARLLAVSPQLLYNLASVEERLDHLVRARDLFEAAAAEAAARANEDVAREASSRAEHVAQRIPRVRLRLPPGSAGAVVTLDSVPVDAEPDPRSVDPGEHRVFARALDGASFELAFTAAAGEERIIEVVFARRDAPEPPNSPVPTLLEKRVPAKPSYAPAAIVGTGAVVLAGLAAATFAAGRAKKELYVERNDAPTAANLSEREELKAAGESLYTASTVFGVGAVVVGGTAVYLLVRTVSGRGTRGAARALWVMPAFGGAAVGGTL